MFKAPKLNIGVIPSLPKCFPGSCFPETHCNNWCITHLTWSCRHFSEQHSTSWIFSPAAICPHRLSLTSVRHAEWAATTLHLHKAHLTATSFMLLSLSMEIDLSLGILLMIPKGMIVKLGLKNLIHQSLGAVELFNVTRPDWTAQISSDRWKRLNNG